MLYRPEIIETNTFVEYYQLPKSIGSVSAGELMDIADHTAAHAARLDTHGRLRFLEVAGSASVEAALIVDRPGEQVDERIALVDQGMDLLREAAEIEYRLLEGGFRDPDDQTDWRRLELAATFGQVSRDILCADVTSDTRHEIIGELDQHFRYAAGLVKHTRFGRTAYGLQQEIRVLRQFWQNYKRDGDPIAFPSTARGGNGLNHADQTHDIVLARLSGSDVTFDTVEVKSANLRKNYHDLTRYAAHLAVVDREGSIRWHDSISA